MSEIAGLDKISQHNTVEFDQGLVVLHMVWRIYKNVLTKDFEPAGQI